MTTDRGISRQERRLLLAIQDGIPIVERPYEVIAERLGTTESHVLEILASLMERGVVKRLGAVPNHYALGITANGMAVWDVPDDTATDFGHRLAQRPAVTHCYRRPRHLPDWPYNLYAMVHGRSRDEVKTTVENMAREAGLDAFPHDLLFSVRQFRKRGTRLAKKNLQE